MEAQVIKDKLLEKAAEVKRIQEKNGFTRTLEQCFYAVCDFFRYILGYTTLDKQTKRDSETFLFATEGPVKKGVMQNGKRKQLALSGLWVCKKQFLQIQNNHYKTNSGKYT